MLTTVYAKLQDNGVLLEGSLLKPSMTVPGVECPDKSDPATIAKMTVQTLDRCLPPAMPGVTFLSGGISEEDSSIYLNEINKLDRKGAFALTFSYSRALQSSCIKIWGGKEDKYKAAQDQLSRARRPTRRRRSASTCRARSRRSRSRSSSRTTPTRSCLRLHCENPPRRGEVPTSLCVSGPGLSVDRLKRVLMVTDTPVVGAIVCCVNVPEESFRF